jgi:hypothetical protein
MVVRCIAAERRRGTGRISVAFQVDSETWANMQRSAKDGGFADTLDYVAKKLCTAFEGDAPKTENTQPAPWNAKSIVPRSRKGGPARIVFRIEPEMWAGMHRSAGNGAHPDVLDYMAGCLNMQFLDDEPIREAGPPTPGDMDDDLPF